MADTLLSIAAVYLTLGTVVALTLIPLIGHLDPAARGAYCFRLLLLPGAVLLWPLVIASTVQAIRRLPQRITP